MRNISAIHVSGGEQVRFNEKMMKFHSDTLPWFRANQSLLLLFNTVWVARMQQIQCTNFILLDIIQHGLEPTIYHTGGNITNHYTVNTVPTFLKSMTNLITHIIPLYNIYSNYIEIRLVETIPRDIYQNIVFPSQQDRISLSTISYFPYSKFSRFNALVI